MIRTYGPKMTALISREDKIDEFEPETILVSMFGKSPEVRLIDFFLDHPINDFMQQEIAERIGMNKRTISKNLPLMLENEVLIMTRTIGKAKLYKLNSESLIVQNIRELERNISINAAQKETSFI